MSNKVKVEFSVAHKTFDGKGHKAGAAAQLDVNEARHVVLIGHGRYADASTEAVPADTTTKEQGR